MMKKFCSNGLNVCTNVTVDVLQLMFMAYD
jgi:hypothetical protein